MRVKFLAWCWWYLHIKEGLYNNKILLFSQSCVLYGVFVMQKATIYLSNVNQHQNNGYLHIQTTFSWMIKRPVLDVTQFFMFSYINLYMYQSNCLPLILKQTMWRSKLVSQTINLWTFHLTDMSVESKTVLTYIWDKKAVRPVFCLTLVDVSVCVNKGCRCSKHDVECRLAGGSQGLNVHNVLCIYEHVHNFEDTFS